MMENEFPMLLLFTVTALVVVLLVAWAAIKLLAKLNRGQLGNSRSITVKQSIAIGSRERLVLVNYEGKELLLGVTAGGISVIDSATSTSPTTDPPQPTID